MSDPAFHKLWESLQAVNPLPDRVREDLEPFFKPFSYKKKEMIIRPGEICHYLYYVVEGMQRAFMAREREYTIAFAYPPFFCVIPDSFYHRTPSKLFLEAITDSFFLGIHYTELETCMRRHPELERNFRLYTQEMVIGMQDRQIELMSMSMEERFDAFCSRSFHLFAKVPHKHIASYLNIDPTNLSKLLRRRTEKLV